MANITGVEGVKKMPLSLELFIFHLVPISKYGIMENILFTIK